MAASQPYIEHEHYYESEWPSRPAQALSYPLDSQLFYVLYAILLGLSSIWWYPSDAWSSLFSGWEGLLVGHQLLFVFYLTRLLIGAPLAKRPDYDMIIRQHSDDFIKNRLKVEQRDEEQTLKRWEEEKRTSSNNIGNGGGDGDGKGDSNCGDDDHENKVQTHPLYSLNAKQDAVRKIEENECNPSSSSSNDEDAENVYDVVIMGAAYAGLCMAAAARKEGLKYLLVEKNTEGVGKVWRDRYNRLTFLDITDLCHGTYYKIKGDVPETMTRDQLAVYLEEYHEHMQLRAMLGTRVAGLEAVPRSVVLSKDEGNGSGCDQMSSGVYSKSIDTNCDDCDNISNQASNSNGTTSTHTNMNHNSNTKSYSAPPASLLCKDASLVRVRLEASSPSPPSTRGARQAYVRTCMQRGGAENAKAFVRPVRAEEEDLTAYVHARHVVVAAGMIKVPFLPRIDDIQLYKGEYLHSSHYTTGAAFQGKRVLIVGCNNSAVEIATDLHEHRAQPTLILRTGSFFNFVHHQAVMNVQNAGVRWGGLMRLLVPVTWLVCNFYLGLYNYLYCGDLSKLGIPYTRYMGPRLASVVSMVDFWSSRRGLGFKTGCADKGVTDLMCSGDVGMLSGDILSFTEHGVKVNIKGGSYQRSSQHPSASASASASTSASASALAASASASASASILAEKGDQELGFDAVIFATGYEHHWMEEAFPDLPIHPFSFSLCMPMFGNLNMMREASICLARAIKQRPLVGFYGYINMKLSSFLMLLCAISYLSYRYLMHDYSDIQTHGELSGGDGERRLSADGSSACLLRVTEAVTPWLAFVLLHACLLSVVRTVLRMNPCWMFP